MYRNPALYLTNAINLENYDKIQYHQNDDFILHFMCYLNKTDIKNDCVRLISFVQGDMLGFYSENSNWTSLRVSCGKFTYLQYLRYVS